ncbi:hypothetical protein Pst134EB_021874 [Puccinia striiformis f. sp. tritici]|uniref:Actin interacting protein 3 C-terminal domain-containing protein n=1 Tax=Puccinia striiformis f. sp. tritici PST-78 TaxID=1165861 RepID=A0A0L0V5N5_9BASI|nr:hypothetical protein Pst134EB_021874 [Puccinia striiformis f. sp. tritici]KNE94587.1 hypothetical protein PSTG_12051 [Puccinia striiformis f. sp. tritici PST-78]
MSIPHSQPRWTGSGSSSSSQPPTNNNNPHPSAGPRASTSSSTRSSVANSQTSAVNPFNSSHMESTVTRLLVATKQLLESLTDWSQGKIDEGGVSDIYVRLGNEFNAASLAFTKEGINMSDLNSVPDDLRACLEAALSEEASPSTLDQHLPQIRQIVVHLLQGLKVKQAKWRAAKRQHENEASYTNRPSSIREHGAPPERPSLPHPSIRSGPRSLNAPRSREDLRRVAVVSTSSHSDHHRSQPVQGYSSGPATHQLSRSIDPSDLPATSKPHDGPPGTRSSYDNPSTGTSPSSKSRMSPVSRAVRSVNDFSDRIRGNKVSSPPPPPPPPPIAPSAYDPSLPNRPENIPIPPTPRSPRSESSSQAQAQASSLEALRKADMLQRRASKRFSTYTYNKIASTASPHKRSGDSQHNLGLGHNVPPMPRSPNSMNYLLPRDDAQSARETSQAGRELLKASSSQRSQDGQSVNENLGSGSRPSSRATEVEDSIDQAKDHVSTITEETQQSIRISPMTPESSKTYTNLISTPPHDKKLARSSINLSEQSCTVFLQLGRDVKKAKLDSTPTISSLRVMFMDRFQFNPGSDSFPEIYLRDPQSGIQYQLEDMSEVKDRVVLSLNIDALDQVKTHIDAGLSTLARELKELKSTITTLRRQSIPPPALSSAPLLKTDSRPPTPIQPAADSQFKQTARQVMKSAESPTVPVAQKPEPAVDSEVPRPPDSTSSSSDVRLQQLNGTFKNQYGEVQELRRDLGILRQLYGTFTGETKSLLAGLRSQAESVKQAATAKVASSRTFIDVGKVKLETQSQDLVTKVESLQDTVEDLKQDVTNRKMKPKPSAMNTVAQSIQTVKSELEQLTNHITTITPAWKKSWEDELQNIVDEQQLLNYQEDLIKDLKEDVEAVSNLFGHVELYLDARKVSKVKPNAFVPVLSPTTPGGFGGLGSGGGGGIGGLFSDPRGGLDTVLMQVKGLEVNAESRLKAIEAAEKLRAKNLEDVSKENEFAQELAGFVGNKKLKMTGGHEEIERLRKIKAEAALKNMNTTPNNNNNNHSSKSSLDNKEDNLPLTGTDPIDQTSPTIEPTTTDQPPDPSQVPTPTDQPTTTATTTVDPEDPNDNAENRPSGQNDEEQSVPLKDGEEKIEAQAVDQSQEIQITDLDHQNPSKSISEDIPLDNPDPS